jgi:hypothetical protein
MQLIWFEYCRVASTAQKQQDSDFVKQVRSLHNGHRQPERRRD